MPFDPRTAGSPMPPPHREPSMRHVLPESGPASDDPVHLFAVQSPGELLDRYHASKRPGDETDPEDTLAPPPLRQDREAFDNLLDGPVIVPRAPAASGGAAFPGRSAVLVPQHGDGENMGADGSQTIIEFKCRAQQGPSTGIELAHFFRNGADPAQLQGAQDIVLDPLQGRELELIISWPGYRRERYMIRVHSETGGPLTRFDLGRQITHAYAFFFCNVERDRLLPNAPGFYNIALHQGRNRRWNTPGIQLAQLRLVRFYNAVSGSWVAEVEIVL